MALVRRQWQPRQSGGRAAAAVAGMPRRCWLLGLWQGNYCTAALLGREGGGGRAVVGGASVTGRVDGGGGCVVILLGQRRHCRGMRVVAGVSRLV